jgi:hypothetical protein
VTKIATGVQKFWRADSPSRRFQNSQRRSVLCENGGGHERPSMQRPDNCQARGALSPGLGEPGVATVRAVWRLRTRPEEDLRSSRGPLPAPRPLGGVASKERGGGKRINGPPPQPSLPAVRHTIIKIIARLPPQRWLWIRPLPAPVRWDALQSAP